MEDGLIRRNPCRIKGAGQEHSQERPVISVSTLLRLLDEVPPRYWALLLLATFANLRSVNSPGYAVANSTRSGTQRARGRKHAS